MCCGGKGPFHAAPRHLLPALVHCLVVVLRCRRVPDPRSGLRVGNSECAPANRLPNTNRYGVNSHSTPRRGQLSAVFATCPVGARLSRDTSHHHPGPWSNLGTAHAAPRDAPPRPGGCENHLEADRLRDLPGGVSWAQWAACGDPLRPRFSLRHELGPPRRGMGHGLPVSRGRLLGFACKPGDPGRRCLAGSSVSRRRQGVRSGAGSGAGSGAAVSRSPSC